MSIHNLEDKLEAFHINKFITRCLITNSDVTYKIRFISLDFLEVTFHSSD